MTTQGSPVSPDEAYLNLHRRMPGEPEPAFEDPAMMAKVWGRNWGLDNDVGRLRTVLVSRPGGLVTFELVVRSGAAADPPDRSGVAYLSAQLLRYGTEEIDHFGLFDRLDDLGGHLRVDVDVSSTTLRGQFMMSF